MSHHIVNPDGLLPPVGFSHAVVATPGQTVYLGGQTGHRGDATLDDGLVAQFRGALANLAVVMGAVGARPDDIVSMQVYVTDAADYRANARELGRAWREVLGPHYPAMALFEVTGLHDPDAVVELLPTVVIPDTRAHPGESTRTTGPDRPRRPDEVAESPPAAGG